MMQSVPHGCSQLHQRLRAGQAREERKRENHHSRRATGDVSCPQTLAPELAVLARAIISTARSRLGELACLTQVGMPSISTIGVASTADRQCIIVMYYVGYR
jgi:hypothetical protein